MEGTERRHRIDKQPRSSTGREWELFVRDTESEPLRHVGSVTASTEETAYDQASELFGRDHADIWICPASAVARYVTDGVEAPTARSAAANGGEIDDLDQ